MRKSWVAWLVFTVGCFATSSSGCAVTPADRAFVQSTRAFHAAHSPRLRDQIAHDPQLRPIEKARLQHEVDDYEVLILANEQRTGLVPATVAEVGSR